MYTAVVLDEKSHLKLVKWAEDNIKKDGIRLPMLVRDQGWKMYCHHMTIAMGTCPDFIKNDLGSIQKLDVTHYGVGDNAIAVRVIGYYSKNLIPHVTVAVNIKDGGKPMDSNKITVWTPVDSVLKLSGEVKQLQ
jgi:hypothetical protein